MRNKLLRDRIAAISVSCSINMDEALLWARYRDILRFANVGDLGAFARQKRVDFGT